MDYSDLPMYPDPLRDPEEPKEPEPEREYDSYAGLWLALLAASVILIVTLMLLVHAVQSG